jgi:hypothetical protein
MILVSMSGDAVRSAADGAQFSRTAITDRGFMADA